MPTLINALYRAASHTVIGAAALLAIAGCQHSPPVGENADPGPYPENYQAIVRAYLHNHLLDPYSVRDLTMTPPVVVDHWSSGWGTRRLWLSCVTYNAKNALGGYTGLETEAFYIKGRGTFMERNPPDCQ